MDEQEILQMLGPDYHAQDLALNTPEAGGDAFQDATGDWGVNNWLRTLELDIMRLLATPEGAVMSVVRDVNQILVLNEDLGSRVHRLLSEPRTMSHLFALRKATMDTLLQEDRIQVVTCDAAFGTEAHAVIIYLEYTLVARPELGSLTLTLGSGPDGVLQRL